MSNDGKNFFFSLSARRKAHRDAVGQVYRARFVRVKLRHAAQKHAQFIVRVVVGTHAHGEPALVLEGGVGGVGHIQLIYVLDHVQFLDGPQQLL